MGKSPNALKEALLVRSAFREMPKDDASRMVDVVADLEKDGFEIQDTTTEGIIVADAVGVNGQFSLSNSKIVEKLLENPW